MRQLEEAKAIAGTGLDGDRYSIGAGTFSKPGPGHEITLIEIEVIESLRERNIMLAAGDARRNLVTRGVPLNHLVGRTFQVGEVHLRGIRFCEPCSHLQKLTPAGVFKALVHRGGLRADIVSGGTIRVGDAITTFAAYLGEKRTFRQTTRSGETTPVREKPALGSYV